MAITTFSSREFNQGTSRAKKATRKGPVFITHRGRPSHVLLTFEDYSKLSGKNGKKQNILDWIAMPEAADIEFEPPRLGDEFPRPADLS